MCYCWATHGQLTNRLRHHNMEVIRGDTLAALHRTMVVLREELEMKNRIITKLWRRRQSRTGKSATRIVSEGLTPSRALLGAAQRCVEVIR